MDEPWKQSGWVQQTQYLLNSFRHWLGRDLIARSGNADAEAAELFRAPFVVVSHGIQSDPILNYGNQTALDLWEVDVAALLQMPSRLTAEPLHRDERARLLHRTSCFGYVDDYQGIRISRTGRRFQIDRAIVWNLLDGSGSRIGQAATFSDWQPLDP